MKKDKIEEITNPKQAKLLVKAKSVLISRMTKPDNDEFKTATFRFFDVNNPHKQGELFPKKIINYTNIEKARIMGLSVSYYLEGNDIVINDMEELEISQEGSKLYLRGKQTSVDRRR